jgi:signal transduction histidine kinase
MDFPLSTSTAYITAGFLYVLVSITAWLMLRNQGAGAPTIWCAGSIVMGSGILLVGMRGNIPPWASFLLANSLIIVGNLMHAYALRLELKNVLKLRFLIVIYFAEILPFAYFLFVLKNPYFWFIWNVCFVGSLVGWTSILAYRIYKTEKSTSAFWLSILNWLLAAALIIRALMTLFGVADHLIVKDSFHNLPVIITVLVTGALSNMTIIGLYLERAKRQSVLLAIQAERSKMISHLGEQIHHSFRERTIDEVSISLAHELGQPITGILFDSSFLKMKYESLGIKDTETNRLFDSLENHALRARVIIEAVSRLVRSNDVKFEPIDVDLMLNDVKQIFLTSITDSKIHIEIDTAQPLSGPLIVNGNRILLSLVFHNLIRILWAQSIGKDSSDPYKKG